LTDYGKLEPRAMLAVFISEFVASNTNSFEDGFGSKPDWVELYNSGSAAVDLNGYTLSDDASDPSAWTFEGNVSIAANQYMVVFASGKDVVDPLGYQHTNFKLSAGGEYIGLYDPAGNPLSSFGSNGTDYPAQLTDISYGLPGGALVDETSTSFFLEPTNNSVDNVWRSNNFDAAANGFSQTSSAIGYENNPGSSTSYVGHFSQNISPGRTSVYLRTEFEVTDASAVSDLLLELKYDDGFVAYLNNTPVAQANSPNSPAFNSTSTGQHNDNFALEYVDFSLNNNINLLQNGTNVLAIHALNQSGSSDFLMVPRLTSNVSNAPANYLATTTPGSGNSGSVSLGPVIESVTQSGVSVNPNQSLVVSARVSDFTLPVDDTSVRLHYRSNFGVVRTLVANDNGTNGDATANDGIFSATVSNVGAAGQLFRWYFTASDTSGNTSRAPRFADPINSAEYFGTVVTDASINTDLPVLQWFVQDTAGTFTDAGARGSLFFNGEFYDNIDTNAHGQSTRGSDFPKKSFDFDSNSGEKFLISADVGRASDFNLLTNYADQTKVRHPLAYDVWQQSGHPASLEGFSVYVQRNGQFYGLYDLIEEGDEEFLDRTGLDSNGALYKVNNRLDSSTNNVDKKSREYEDNSDLQMLVNANQGLTGNALSAWIYDNIEVSTLINYLAVNATIANNDFGHKNMYWYFDAEGTGLWSVLPWDQDLSFGHRWGGAQPPYFDNVLYTNASVNGGFNNIFQRVYADSTLDDMFDRRLRSMSDAIYGAPGTDVADSYFNTRANQLASLVADEASEDRDLWGQQANFDAYPDGPAEAIEQFDRDFAIGRRNYIGSRNGVPSSQTGTPAVRFNDTDLDVSPASGLQSQEYIRIDNPTNQAADISQWKLTGGISHEFLSGTVIPAGGALYVVADVAAFKARTTGPRGGQSLYIQGGYQGQIANTGETINLIANTGQSVDVLNTPASNRTNNQDFLRVTEVNYNPSSALAGTEYIEFFNRNTSGLTLDLSGVTVSEGFSTPFVFPAGTTLGAGEYLLIVEDVAAFTGTYTSVPTNKIIGAYIGNLNNNGETIRVDDAGGEKILEFDYNDSFPWAQAADGAGASLELTDADLTVDLLDKHYAWRASPRTGGSPNGISSSVNPSVVINEVLAHTDLPDVDFIELSNISQSAVDVSGWFLSDSSEDLEKFVIPAGTLIPAGGQIVFDEDDFNSGSPAAGEADFALSSNGDEVWLTARDNTFANGHKFIDEVAFAATFNGQSIGTFEDGSPLAPQLAITKGQPNSAADVGLLISEVNYNPAEPTPAQIAIDPTFESSDLEFIEIHNPTAAAINLADWRIRGEVDFDFAATSIAAGATIVVTKFDPTTNSAKASAFGDFYDINSSVILAGGYSGRLSNSWGLVRLQAPDAPPVNDPTNISHVDVDRMLYDDQGVFTTTDGDGDSVNRIGSNVAGLNPANYDTASPTPGAVNLVTTGPTIASMIRDGNNGARPDLIDSIEIVFDSDVNVSRNDLTFSNLTAGGTSVNLTGVTFSYDANTFTAAWDFENIATDLDPAFYSAVLSSSVTGVRSGLRIDGDGDGNAGGDFVQDVYVAIPGDANLDGVVTINRVNIFTQTNDGDFAKVLANHQANYPVNWSLGDFNADGDVDFNEVNIFAGTNVGDGAVVLSNLGRDVRV